MQAKNYFRRGTSEENLEIIRNAYLKIDFLIQEDQAVDSDEAKDYINSIVFHGNASDAGIAISYAENHGCYKDYVDLGNKYELYEYIDHEAVQEEVDTYGTVDIADFIDYDALEEDMFEMDIFIDGFYRFDGNVFEITEGKITWKGDFYIDPNIAEQSYKSVKALIDNGHHIDMATNITYENFMKEVA